MAIKNIVALMALAIYLSSGVVHAAAIGMPEHVLHPGLAVGGSQISIDDPNGSTAEVPPPMPAEPMQKQLPEPEQAPVKSEGSEVEKKSAIELRLTNLLFSYILAYEGGDFGSFMDLFSEDAIVDESEGKAEIAKDYWALFQETAMRRMVLDEVSWKSKGGLFMGHGMFKVSVLNRTDDIPMELDGNIKIEVEERGDRLLISKLTHELNR